MNFKKILLTAGFLALSFGASLAAEAPLSFDVDMRGTAPEGLQFPMEARFKTLHSTKLDRYAIHQQAASGATIPLWSTTTTASDGKNYTYTMVGQNPFVKLSDPSTTINAVIVPIKVNLITGASSTTFDPTATDTHGCLPPGKTAISLTEDSPIFQNVTISGVGTSQYTDLFQRANYIAQTVNGQNPGYHVLLSPTLAPAFTLNVGGSSSNLKPAKCGDGGAALGLIDIDLFDALIQKEVFPLMSNQLNANTLPIFVLYNVALYSNFQTSDCCILGYHNSFTSNGLFQTYAVAEFDSTNLFKNNGNVSLMSHEIGEWMDDPNTSNPTPSWGNIGQVSGCQTDLEVGDPLTGTTESVPLNGFNYLVQDLTFHNWFYGLSPSGSLNGWYSLLGNFTSPAAPC